MSLLNVQVGMLTGAIVARSGRSTVQSVERTTAVAAAIADTISG